jgi:hypothetical protein
MKLLKILVVVVVLLLGGYTGFWFYQSNQLKAVLEDNLTKLSQNLAQSGGEFSYEGISVSGFPLKLTLDINSPLFRLPEHGPDQEGALYTISGNGPVSVGVAMFAPESIKVVLPQAIDIASKRGEASESIQLSYTKPAEVEVEFEGVSTFDLLLGKAPQTGEELAKAFRRFSYVDNGSQVVDGVSGKAVASQDAGTIRITYIPEGERVRAGLLFKALNSKVTPLAEGEQISSLAKEWIDMYQNLGDADAVVDVAYEGPSALPQVISGEGKVEIRELSISNDKFGFDAKGIINKAADDLMPFGEIKVNLTNYEQLVDNIAASIQRKMQEASAAGQPQPSAFALEEPQLIVIKNFLRKVSDEPAGNSPNLTITISREKGASDAMVGTLSGQEVGLLGQQTSQDLMIGQPGAAAPGAVSGEEHSEYFTPQEAEEAAKLAADGENTQAEGEGVDESEPQEEGVSATPSDDGANVAEGVEGSEAPALPITQ